MILRNNAHPRGIDLGPRQLHGSIASLLDPKFFRPMPEGMTWRVTDRRWLVTKTPEEQRYDKRRYDNAHRSAHAEHYRVLERERARRYRERKRASINVVEALST